MRLHHDAEDERKGIRAYMPDVIGGIKSHMDVQASDGRGMLLRYVASYVPKFSDSFATAWLNDQASAYIGINDIYPQLLKYITYSCFA